MIFLQQTRRDPAASFGFILKHHFSAFLFFCGFYILFFAPVIFSGKLLASGDALIYHYPAVMRSLSIWTDTLMSGYPLFADSQAMTWYPLRFLGLSFNAFVISAYVLSSFFTYGFVNLLSGSRFAGIVSGLAYGMSGSLMIHEGHTAIIHAAAWIPLLLWSILRLSLRKSLLWIVFGALSVCGSFLAGHPQIFVNGMILGGSYAVFKTLSIYHTNQPYTKKLVTSYVSVFLLGFGLSAIQAFPSAEIIPFSLRKTMTFDDFVSYEFLLQQWPIIFFPNIFGSFSSPWLTYFGHGSGLVEASCYFGLSSILLLSFAWQSEWKRPEIIFWTVSALIAFAYGLGNQTILAKIAFHIAVLNKFRAPARMLLVANLCVAILIGVGAAQMTKHEPSRQRIYRSLGITAFIVVLLLAGIWLAYPDIASWAAQDKLAINHLFYNPAVYSPLLFLSAMAGIVAFGARRSGNLLKVAMLLVLISDLASFDWFLYWRPFAATPPVFEDPIWNTVRSDTSLHGRVSPVNGITGGLSPGEPNLSILFGIPSTTGYGPLAIARYVEATGMTPYGGIDLVRSPALVPLLDVKWLLTASTSRETDTPLSFGRTCGIDRAGPLKARLPREITATRVEIVSSLGCSPSIPDGATVLNISLADATGSEHHEISLQAGRDTSEFSIDSPAVKGSVKHRRAPIFESFPATGFTAYHYLSTQPIDGKGTRIHVGTISLVLPTDAPVITINSINLVDDSTGTRNSIPLWRFGLQENQWGESDIRPDGVELIRRRENSAAAWLVREVQYVTSEEAVKALQTGVFSDGTRFDPTVTALLENPATPVKDLYSLGQGSVNVLSHEPTKWMLSVDAKAAGFLVLSQTDYPGWTATINGLSIPIVTTDHAFQGISVPRGRSVVKFKFQSTPLLLGATVSGVCLLICLSLAGYSLLGDLRRGARSF